MLAQQATEYVQLAALCIEEAAVELAGGTVVADSTVSQALVVTVVTLAGERRHRRVAVAQVDHKSSAVQRTLDSKQAQVQAGRGTAEVVAVDTSVAVQLEMVVTTAVDTVEVETAVHTLTVGRLLADDTVAVVTAEPELDTQARAEEGKIARKMSPTHLLVPARVTKDETT